MSCPEHKQIINVIKFGLATLCLSFTNASMAEWNDNPSTESAYVDSIHQWGAWELDIEPAAGGITPASTKALNARDPKVSFRINSIAALAPNALQTTPTPPTPSTTPTIPTIRPISPSVPIPVGGPSDGF
jgi:hypothetical protein